MFTGIVEESGRVQSITPGGNARFTSWCVRRVCARAIEGGRQPGGQRLLPDRGENKPARAGAAAAIRPAGRNLATHQLPRPASGVRRQFGARRSAPAARMDGHFVTGHIDGVGKITRWERSGRDHVLDISAPADIMRYIVVKGSVAVDGISLTVAAARAKSFRIWIIPHTLAVTALRERRTATRSIWRRTCWANMWSAL